MALAAQRHACSAWRQGPWQLILVAWMFASHLLIWGFPKIRDPYVYYKDTQKQKPLILGNSHFGLKQCNKLSQMWQTLCNKRNQEGLYCKDPDWTVVMTKALFVLLVEAGASHEVAALCAGFICWSGTDSACNDQAMDDPDLPKSLN